MIILRTIFDLRVAAHNPNLSPIVFILDEAHSLSWDDDSMAVKLLREGRKFHLSGWFVSQYVRSNVADAALSQAALKIHFRPDDKNLPKLVKPLASADREEAADYYKLAQNLSLGQFLMQNNNGQLAQVNVDPSFKKLTKEDIMNQNFESGTIRQTLKRLHEDGHHISESALRIWVKSGLIPANYCGIRAYL